MSLFVIADLHLSFGTDKPMDVFEGWKDYTGRLEKNWNSIVKETDTVVLAGDISWAMKLEETYNDFSYIHNLPGTKLILKGNHDYWWATKNKMDAYLSQNKFDDIKIIHNNAYLVDGVAVCGTRGWLYNIETKEDEKIMHREAGRLMLSLAEAKKLADKQIVFLHYPPVYDGKENQAILDVLLSNNIAACYFGHIHGKHAAKKAPTGEYKGVKMHLISCDYVNFCPVKVF